MRRPTVAKIKTMEILGVRPTAGVAWSALSSRHTKRDQPPAIGAQIAKEVAELTELFAKWHLRLVFTIDRPESGSAHGLHRLHATTPFGPCAVDTVRRS
jgi:hypothetical protein